MSFGGGRVVTGLWSEDLALCAAHALHGVPCISKVDDCPLSTEQANFGACEGLLRWFWRQEASSAPGGEGLAPP